MDFDRYQQNQQILSQVTRHTTSSIKILQTRVAQWNNATVKEMQADLDLVHFIFKHGRACCSSFASACAAQILYPQLARLVLDQTNDKKTTALSYSLLVCMVDLVKQDSLFSLTSSQLLKFITMASPLWLHHKIYICRKSMELCYRLLYHAIDDNQGSIIVNSVVLYIRQCRIHMTRADVEKIRSHEYTEFYFNYFNGVDTLPMIYDRTTITWLVQITFALFLKQVGNHQALIKEIKDLYKSNCLYNMRELLFDICCANDDDTVQFLDTILSIYQQPQQQTAQFFSTIDINPHSLFLFFVQKCGNTHDILIDLLLENDSGFISYFHRYILYATRYMDAFKDAIHSSAGTDLDTIQTIITNTILVLERDGFPYNAKPLIRRLTIFEEKLFEG
ncbi:hypothetical protein BD408DRAFT_445883 [Parasitella parasitica]|nr:hypothetical protein BD408DRAFT_445883 [Parasitella parasitica]